jgi:hypothetical protein
LDIPVQFIDYIIFFNMNEVKRHAAVLKGILRLASAYKSGLF